MRPLRVYMRKRFPPIGWIHTLRACLLILLFTGCQAAAQQPVLVRIPIEGAMLIAPDTQGGIYATAIPEREPVIVHYTATGELRTLVTEEDVHQGENEYGAHIEEDGEFKLMHSPGELWLSGDGAKLLFPVYRHVHPWHLTDVMMLEDGKIAPLLAIDQKLRYSYNGQACERFNINSRKAVVALDRYQILSLLSSEPSGVLGNQQVGQLTTVLFTYRPSAAAGEGEEVTAYLDMEQEDREYNVVSPGCLSKFDFLFAMGIPSTGFFQPPSFTLLQADGKGTRQTVATDVRLGENAFACSGKQASVIYRDRRGATRFLTLLEGGRPQSFFDGNTIDSYPLGEISHHAVTADAVHLFLMKVPDGKQGVFAVDASGTALTLLPPGFAGTGRVVKSMVASAGRLFFHTDVENVREPPDPWVFSLLLQ